MGPSISATLVHRRPSAQRQLPASIRTRTGIRRIRRFPEGSGGEEYENMKIKILMLLVAAGFLGGCENMTTNQKGAVTGAAPGTGSSAVTRPRLRTGVRRPPA